MVGVILNLTVFLGQAVLIPGGVAVDWTAVAAGAVAFALLASGWRTRNALMADSVTGNWL